MLKNVFILTLTIVICGCSTKKDEVDLMIHHARIYSVDSSFTIYEAMVVKEGKIVELNTNENILKKYISKKSLHLIGKPVFPGFIDAHCHFTGYATDMWKCNLTGTTSYDEVLEKIKSYSKNAPMSWIYGRGWDQNDWTINEFPNKKQLDSLFPNQPVFLKRIDGHAALVNQKALDMAGINIRTKVDGGSVEIKNGKLSGILLDNAMDLVDKIIPIVNDSLTRLYYKKTEEICFSFGLTQVHDCGVSEHTVELLDEEQQAGRLNMNVYALLSDDSTYYDKWIKRGIYKTDKLTVGGFKLYADGALGSRGACLLHPYSDKENWNGFLLTNTKRLNSIAQKLIATNFQLCTHAIGDSANRQILNTYGSVLKGKNNRRWRIEHAQVVNEDDFSLFKKFDVFPSVQPTHATSDMYWANQRVGNERIHNAYAYKKLLNSYSKIALGTDFPVEDISTFKTFYAAVVRQDAKGFPKEGFQKENSLTRTEALKGMTIWASYACFEEHKKGSLEKGKVADFVILDNDLMTCDESIILKTKVLNTFLNGSEVYRWK